MSDDSTKKLNGSQDDKLDEIISLVREMDGRLRNVETRLSSLEQKVDERLYDTRPLWEGVQVQLAEIKVEVDELKSEIGELRTGQEKGFRKVDRQFDMFSKTLREPTSAISKSA